MGARVDSSRRSLLLGALSGAVAVKAAAAHEAVLDPQLPIIDPHIHLWDLPGATGPMAVKRFLLPELLETLDCGHNIVATVFVEASAMYRADGPVELRSLGETEFANGQAAMAASGVYAKAKPIAGIVGKVDLTLGERVGDILELHKRAAGGRFKGVRQSFAYSPFPVFGRASNPKYKDLIVDPAFRRGFAQLARHGLVYDGWGYHTQLDQFIDLARAFPDTTLVLDHAGAPLHQGPHATSRGAVMRNWKGRMAALARLPNVVVKVGGLGRQTPWEKTPERARNVTAQDLSPIWKPYVETCIALFGVDRCMFESNYPSEASTCRYGVIWDTFKTIVAGASPDEKAALFAGTARRVYKLEV